MYLPVEKVETILTELCADVPEQADIKAHNEVWKKKIRDFRDQVKEEIVWDNRFLPVNEVNELLDGIMNRH